MKIMRTNETMGKVSISTENWLNIKPQNEQWKKWKRAYEINNEKNENNGRIKSDEMKTRTNWE